MVEIAPGMNPGSGLEKWVLFYYKFKPHIKIPENVSEILQKKNSIVEIPDKQLDEKYVENNVLTNTDRFLEKEVFGEGTLRTWHLIIIISGAVLITGIDCCIKLKFHKLNPTHDLFCSHCAVVHVQVQNSPDQIGN